MSGDYRPDDKFQRRWMQEQEKMDQITNPASIKTGQVTFGEEPVATGTTTGAELTMASCDKCDGEGLIWADGKKHSPLQAGIALMACPDCNGTGKAGGVDEIIHRLRVERDQWKARAEAAEQEARDMQAGMEMAKNSARLRGERIAELEQRCAELAAALAEHGPCRQCGGYGSFMGMTGCDLDGNFGEAEMPCPCGGVDPSQILAARLDEARKEGAVAMGRYLAQVATRLGQERKHLTDYIEDDLSSCQIEDATAAVESGELKPWEKKP